MKQNWRWQGNKKSKSEEQLRLKCLEKRLEARLRWFGRDMCKDSEYTGKGC